ncbi:MAG: 16S rRNA (guanine(966)-N(2))-methyltransferase RsmD [Campylobacteraceae bacterium]|jgi:16S rRNA (guanine(966)-N(2))-methyltransferase RsmD|nr:16S rRNA (guanine(966)-N(2))-methyltransferase RsmD [Campylobacteraceae bacterium]
MKTINKKLTTKIIAGKYKGKTIALADISVTRSTKSIIRESVFNTLQGEIENAVFVEVFAGSGTMGIEALSRKAAFVHFLEKNRNSYFCIQDNLDSLNAENARVYNVDSFEYFPNLLNSLQKEEKRIFYFDPPFSIRENMDGIYEDTIDLIKQIRPKQLDIVVVEYMTGYELPSKIGSFGLQKSKKFGKSSVAYYTL